MHEIGEVVVISKEYEGYIQFEFVRTTSNRRRNMDAAVLTRDQE